MTTWLQTAYPCLAQAFEVGVFRGVSFAAHQSVQFVVAHFAQARALSASQTADLSYAAAQAIAVVDIFKAVVSWRLLLHFACESFVGYEQPVRSARPLSAS